MIRITVALTGALAVLTFSTATAHACGSAGNGFADCPDLPTNIDFNLNTIGVYEIPNPLFYQQTETTNLDFSVLNAPDQTFEGTVLYRLGEYGGENYNLSVAQDISGNIPSVSSTTTSLSPTSWASGARFTTTSALRRRLS